MNDDPLQRLTTLESLQVWERFDAAFDFTASMHVFPAITEPVGSVTWSLQALDDDPDRLKLDRLVALVQDALTVCTPPGSALLILEWQNTSYRLRPDLRPTDMFLPDALGGGMRPGWPRSPFPDGDYPVLLAEDFAYGSFGHPWEQSLCLFGAGLLAAVADEVDGLLTTVLRRSGRPVARD